MLSHSRTDAEVSHTPRIDATALLAIAVPCLALVFWNTWTHYSYWLDELWSIALASQSWAELLSGGILHDVHPPLYPLILKIWVGVFGTAEGATRVLSGMFAAATLVLLASCFKTESIAFKAALLGYVATAPAFAYYGQETRSYALILLLATAVTLLSVRQLTDAPSKKHLRYVLMVLLALTHYFGLIYVGLLLLFDFIKASGRKERYELVLVGMLTLVWPVLQAYAGGLLSQAGGNFWIESKGPLTTIKRFLAGVAPWLGNSAEAFKDSAGMPAAVFAAVFLAAAMVFVGLRMSRERRRQCAYLALLIVSFLALLIITDRHTPMSIPRYYIVLLPAVAFVFAFLFDTLFHLRDTPTWRVGAGVGLTAFLAWSAVQSLDGLREKWQPHQNWKVLGAELVSRGVCDGGCFIVGGFGLHRFYFQPRAAGHHDTRGVITADQAVEKAKTDGVPIIGLHTARDNFPELRAAYPGWNCYEPRQGWRLSTFVMTPERVAFDRLLPCREDSET